MKNKKELRNRVYIEDDLTWREREIQRRLGDIAKEKREEGRREKGEVANWLLKMSY